MNDALVKRAGAAVKIAAPDIERQNTINSGWQAQRERSDIQERAMSTRVQVAKGRADLAIAEEVDAVIVAGDLYDGSQTSMVGMRIFVSVP